MSKFNFNQFSQNYKNQTLDSVHGNGSVSLEGTKILGLVQVNGSLNAKESEIHSLQVNGHVDVKNCEILNLTNINGYLKAENSKFKSNISIASNKITLKSCVVDSILVRKDVGCDEIQELELEDGTQIIGTVVFESNEGVIWTGSNSTISESQVSGAKIYKR